MSNRDTGEAGRMAARARRAQQAVSELGAGPLPALPSRREWHELTVGLLELEAAGALGGIRAVVAERLAQVRGDHPSYRGSETARAVVRLMRSADLPGATRADRAGCYVIAAAMLAAEIGRSDPGTGGER